MRISIFLAICIALSSNLSAQDPDYIALLRRCAQHEANNLSEASRLRFLERTQWQWGTETRLVIETREGRADRIVLFNDTPLAPDQQHKQQSRLQKLLKDVTARHDELADQKSESRRRLTMAQALPDAFILQFAGKEPDGQIRFTFSPNPDFDPRSREAQVYKGMRGTLWIDAAHERITHVQGELFKDVSFGWGIFGRLYKGGHYEIIQSQVRPGVWRITTLNLDFRARVFLFNQFRIFRKEVSSGFTPVAPETTFENALQALLSNHEQQQGQIGQGSN